MSQMAESCFRVDIIVGIVKKKKGTVKNIGYQLF